ncbi:Wzz/FepE/Etk N-terminal domain-containing protein [Plebeiibacterium marinum]|uniref:Wzz/FepE/Etk N-terminal domain-containing protein n=1 Tax=Plebeiibacterium marinum TaxID=2992111 RepID=A0AAE3ME69_9BACT|nr:Wzz/FepE/Etk N-terminal domain-containing protein [Plebeiobacterium marinum]MCW3805801.1 Wzz/FepE/Etk N-terminal domain-containing protein [Plebeiobacterium marinum]
MDTNQNILKVNKTQTDHQIIKDDEIDLIALIKTIWDGRKIIYYSVGVCVFIGLLIAFLSPTKYTASATLLPSSENKSSSVGGLGALAGMAGINLSSMMGQSDGIPAEIYPQIVNSYPFLNEFIYEKFHFEEYEQPISIYDYVVADTIPSVGSQIAKYTIRLPWTIKEKVFSNEKKGIISNVDYGVLYLSEEELKVIESVYELFRIGVDEETGLVVITVEVEEPILAAQFVKKAVKLLQRYIIEYKTKQVREHLKFVKGRYEEKKQEYEKAQLAFYNYKDSHRNIISERVDPEFQRLSDEYDITLTVYKDLSTQLEAAKIAVKEESPVFSVIEPAKVPDEKSSPVRKSILLISMIVGVFFGVCLVIGLIIYDNIKDKLK